MKKLMILPLLALISACGPTLRIIKYEPLTNEGRWENGDQYFVKEIDSIEVSIAYISGTTFKVTVVNRSAKQVLVSPELFYYVSNTHTDTVNKQINVPHYATDPEPIVDEAQAAYDKELQNVPRSYALLGLANDVVSIANLASNKPKKEKARIQREIDYNEARRLQNYNNAVYEHEQKLYNYSQKLDYWKNHALRKTTLLGNQQIAGDVLFNMGEIAYLIIAVPINGVLLPFEFKAKYQ